MSALRQISILTVVTLALGLGIAGPALAQEDAEHPSTHAPLTPRAKMVVVSIPLPAGSESFAMSDLPEPICQLLQDGWHISHTDLVGKSADAKQVMVLLVLDKESRRGPIISGDMPPLHMLPFGRPGRPGMGPEMGQDTGPAPGAGTPTAPAPKGEVTVHWKGGETSVITIGEATGVRSKAHVSTSDAQGTLEAEYEATAFIDDQGDTEVDGRGATLGHHAESYVPDSFRIHPDGRVDIEDDGGTRDSGTTKALPKKGSRPTGERQL